METDISFGSTFLFSNGYGDGGKICKRLHSPTQRPSPKLAWGTPTGSQNELSVEDYNMPLNTNKAWSTPTDSQSRLPLEDYTELTDTCNNTNDDGKSTIVGTFKSGSDNKQ